MNSKDFPLVSIIIPVYNAAKFLEDTIKTVLNQTYKNFEVIFIDDKSTDNSVKIINKYKNNDDRIKLIKNKINSGAAISRNNGIIKSKGEYLCFLDADDLWDNQKLEKQINFMQKNDCEFSFTGYEFANSNGIPNGKKVYIPEKINYNHALKNTTIWTSTVMFNTRKLAKEEMFMPIVKSEDTALWWKILRIKKIYAYGLNEILSFYRRSKGTLSSNKIEAIKRIWNLYRNVENLNLFKSLSCFTGYAFNTVKRRI